MSKITSKKIFVIISLLAISNMASSVDFYDSVEDSSYLDYQQATALMMDTDVSGDPKAQYELALIFNNGSKGYVDIGQAKILFNLAAENGYPPAQKYLANAYKNGNFGFEKNNQLSSYWGILYKNKVSTLY